MLNTEDAKNFLLHAETEMFPKIEASAMSMILCDGRHDAAVAVQLGAALLMDKPLVLVVQKGMYVPGKLRLIADEIVEVDALDDQAKEALILAVRRLKERIGDL